MTSRTSNVVAGALLDFALFLATHAPPPMMLGTEQERVDYYTRRLRFFVDTRAANKVLFVERDAQWTEHLDDQAPALADIDSDKLMAEVARRTASLLTTLKEALEE